ncbi:MAG: small multidrug resistance pump [Planctomycetota bacterium]|jgi:small multidrug resistance pump
MQLAANQLSAPLADTVCIQGSNLCERLAMNQEAPRWAKRWLAAAAIYNLVWGAFIVLSPGTLFEWCQMEQPRYVPIWQCVGMIVGVYGVGYAIAASNPIRHWPLVLVGLLGKVFGPIGFIEAAWTGQIPLQFGWTILTNDLLWWPAFGRILWIAWRAR